MNKPTLSAPRLPSRGSSSVAEDVAQLSSLLATASAMMNASRYEEAIALLTASPVLVARHPLACNTLAYLLLQADRPMEAIVWFKTAIVQTPEDIQAIMGFGRAQEALGAHDQALQLYEKAVFLRPGDTEAWFRRACTLSELGRRREALDSLNRVMALDPKHGGAAAKRRDVIDLMGDLQAAIEAAIACCRIVPKEALPLRKLADLLQRFGNLDQAVKTYDMAMRFAAQDFHIFHNKALALRKLKRNEEALACAQQALRLDPDDRDTMMMCGGLEMALGNVDAANACFSIVASHGPARRYETAGRAPSLRASLLFSPVAGNTPYEDLIRGSSFDSQLFIIVPSYRYETEVVAQKADVVVNLVSEADLGADVFDNVIDLTDRMSVPVINDPRVIVTTDRQTVARKLSGIANTVMPVNRRVTQAELQAMDLSTVRLPVIIRHAGTHGGDRMEKVETVEELLAFAAEAGDSALYLTDYVDYGSPDGLFRKYRFIFVGDRILPYHLAIGDQWKVHHASTRMATVEWMRDEEAAFLEMPEKVFGPEAMAALDEIRRAIGLDYFGIDCSLDADGRILIFEVNASMLIHLNNKGFEYKDPYVHRIRKAFDQMLQEKVRAFGRSAA